MVCGDVRAGAGLPYTLGHTPYTPARQPPQRGGPAPFPGGFP